jgi:hypothetical protein
VTLSFPLDSGNLISEGVNWNNFEAENVSRVAPKSSLDIHQIVGVSATAELNARAMIRINLFVSYPEDGSVDEGALPLQLIHQVDFTVKISSAYEYRNDAAFVVVTNSDTPNDNVQALRHFIEDELKSKMDLWNLGLYGGLQYPYEEGETTPRTVLSSYSGKSIIFLGNQFNYFGHGSRNALQLCDVKPLAQASQDGTSCLFLGYSNAASRNHLKGFTFPISHKLSESAHVAREATHFSTKQKLLKSIRERSTVGFSAFTTYTMLVKFSGLGDRQAHTRREAESITLLLREQMPQERFLVSSLYPIPKNSLEFNLTIDTGRLRKKQNSGLVVIYCGLSQSKSIRMTESYPIHHIQHVEEPPDKYDFISSLGQVRTSPQTKPQLDPFDAYMCVASLPLPNRLGILCSNGGSEGGVMTRSTFVLQATELSLIEELNREVRTLLQREPWLNSLHLCKDPNVALSLYFPKLAAILRHSDVITLNPLPERILKIFRYTLASSFPEKKRHIVKNYVVPFGGQHAQVQQFLITMISEFLKGKHSSEESLEEFCLEARSLKSPTDGKNRHVSRIIQQEIAALTKKSEHEYAGSCKTTGDMTHTMYCEEAEWDAMVQGIQESQQRIAKDIAHARSVLNDNCME